MNTASSWLLLTLLSAGTKVASAFANDSIEPEREAAHERAGQARHAAEHGGGERDGKSRAGERARCH